MNGQEPKDIGRGWGPTVTAPAANVLSATER